MTTRQQRRPRHRVSPEGHPAALALLSMQRHCPSPGDTQMRACLALNEGQDLTAALCNTPRIGRDRWLCIQKRKCGRWSGWRACRGQNLGGSVKQGLGRAPRSRQGHVLNACHKRKQLSTSNENAHCVRLTSGTQTFAARCCGRCVEHLLAILLVRRHALHGAPPHHLEEAAARPSPDKHRGTLQTHHACAFGVLPSIICMHKRATIFICHMLGSVRVRSPAPPQ